jgi:hypothetical protein
MLDDKETRISQFNNIAGCITYLFMHFCCELLRYVTKQNVLQARIYSASHKPAKTKRLKNPVLITPPPPHRLISPQTQSIFQFPSLSVSSCLLSKSQITSPHLSSTLNSLHVPSYFEDLRRLEAYTSTNFISPNLWVYSCSHGLRIASDAGFVLC